MSAEEKAPAPRAYKHLRETLELLPYHSLALIECLVTPELGSLSLAERVEKVREEIKRFRREYKVLGAELDARLAFDKAEMEARMIAEGESPAAFLPL